VNRARASVPGLVLLCASAAAGAAEPAPGAAATGYRDKLIEGGNLPVEVVADEYAGHGSAGWPRALYAEAAASRIRRDGTDLDESGVRFGGMLDTPNYGAFTLDATLRLSGTEDGTGNMISLVQRGMPVSSAWRMNSSVGVNFSPSADLARRQTRFFVPAIQMSGTAAEWRRLDEVQAFVTYGEPSIYTGFYIPSVESLGGRMFGGGLQWNLTDRWSAAAQVVDVDGTRTEIERGTPKVTVRSSFGAVAWETPDGHVQLNVAESRREDGPRRSGAWLDTVLRQGRVGHSLGGFYLDPDLVWGNQQLASDASGGYYRASYQSRRWMLDGGLDYANPVSRDTGDVIYGTAYARYQYSTRFGFGGGANLRRNLAAAGAAPAPLPVPLPGDVDERDWSSAWSAFGFVDAANRWGLARGQLNHAQDDFEDLTQLTLDQTWNTHVGQRLSTSVFAGRSDLVSGTENSAGLAVTGGGDLRRNLSIDANARWNKRFGDAGSNDLFANIALIWGFARGWSASANFYQNRSDGRLPLVVGSPVLVDETDLEYDRNDTGVYLRVRYDWRAGAPTAPLGGGHGAGAGRISGVLFLDDNDNGRQDAGETGAPGVVVLLNGRFAARTDAAGRFEFASVVAGNHSLSVVPDNLPLAWTVPLDTRYDLRVGVRGQTRVELPARRQR
jgi:hypothetical protein